MEKLRYRMRSVKLALFHNQWGCGNIESVIIMQLQISDLPCKEHVDK